MLAEVKYDKIRLIVLHTVPVLLYRFLLANCKEFASPKNVMHARGCWSNTPRNADGFQFDIHQFILPS